MGRYARAHRLPDGGNAVDYGKRPASQRFTLGEAEMSADPRSDHAGIPYEDSALRNQNDSFKKVVPVQRTGYEGWPIVRPRARADEQMGPSARPVSVVLGCPTMKKFAILTVWSSAMNGRGWSGHITF